MLSIQRYNAWLFCFTISLIIASVKLFGFVLTVRIIWFIRFIWRDGIISWAQKMYKIIYKIGNKILPGPASHCLIPSQTLCPSAALSTPDLKIVATALPALPLVKPFASRICFSGYSMQFHHFELSITTSIWSDPGKGKGNPGLRRKIRNGNMSIVGFPAIDSMIFHHVVNKPPELEIGNWPFLNGGTFY